MAELDLNLSTRPFPAYRLVNIAAVLILIVLVVLSVWQTVGFMRYSRLARSIRAEEQDNRVQAEALGKRVEELESRLDRPESTAKLNEIGFLNRLILRKNLSWSRLFANLEEIIPDNVYFTGVTPDFDPDGGIRINLGVRARSITDATEFIERVEKSALFEKVVVASQSKADSATSFGANDVEVMMTAVYHPERDTR